LDKTVEVEQQSGKKNSYLSLKTLDEEYHYHLCGCSFSSMLIHTSVGSPIRSNGCIIFWYNIVGKQFLMMDHEYGD